jgi:COX assembly protein 2
MRCVLQQTPYKKHLSALRNLTGTRRAQLYSPFPSTTRVRPSQLKRQRDFWLEMHPPLFRPHPKCGHVVDLLVACHEKNVWGKFMGMCNEEKAALDKCFRAEKEEVRAANLKKAREMDKIIGDDWARPR